MFNSLQLKHTQSDTLSYFILSRISTLYTDPSVLQEFAMSRYIYPQADEEIPPQIILAFKEETYHNVPDFWDLWINLRNSLTRAILARERDIIARLNQETSETSEPILGAAAFRRVTE